MQLSEKVTLPEHIRTHAEMYIGKIGEGSHPNDGIYLLLQEVLNYFVDEFQEGYGKKIEIQIQSGQIVTIRDYGRGLSFDERYSENHHSIKTAEVTSFGLDTVNALSSYMDVEIYRNGVVDWFSYEEGVLIHKLTNKTKCKDGIAVTFALHDLVFGTSSFKEEIVYSMLRNISYLNVGLEIVYGRIRIKSKGGMAELLADKKRSKGYYLYPIIHFKNEWVEAAFTHSLATNETYYSFVNGQSINQGNIYLDAFKDAVTSVLMEFYSSEGFISEDVYSGLVGAIAIKIKQQKLEQVNIKEVIHTFFYEKCKNYLLEHRNVCDFIYGKMSVAKDKREFRCKCLLMGVKELVELWNKGVDSGQLSSDDLYAIRDAFLEKNIQTIEMQRADAIGKRFAISYDEKNNVIHCSGRHFFEDSEKLFQL